MPSRIPMIMASTVMISVVRAPRSTGAEKMLSNMNRHENTGFVTSMWTNMATRTAITAAAPHRHGCRTGTARICSGGAGRVVVSVLIAGVRPASADGGVHRGVGDGPGLDAPVLEHLRVAAVGDQRLHGAGQGLGELRLVLLDDVSVGRRVVDVAEQLELAAGLLHRVGHDGGVGEAGVVLAGDDRRSGLVLAGVLVDRDGLLPARGARRRAGGDVVYLH